MITFCVELAYNSHSDTCKLCTVCCVPQWEDCLKKKKKWDYVKLFVSYFKPSEGCTSLAAKSPPNPHGSFLLEFIIHFLLVLIDVDKNVVCIGILQMRRKLYLRS